MDYDIKNIKLAEKGKLRIEWARRQMPVLNIKPPVPKLLTNSN